MDTTRPTWMPAQVTVEATRDFHIVMEGQATNGGFAVDDITFTPGSCPSMCSHCEFNFPKCEILNFVFVSSPTGKSSCYRSKTEIRNVDLFIFLVCGL